MGFAKYSSILLLLFLIPLLASCDNDRIIVYDLEEREANEITVLLATHGVQAKKVPVVAAQGGGGPSATTFNITVPDKDAIAAMSILNNAGLPRRPTSNLLKLFSTTGLVSTDMEQKIRYQAGLAEQISSTIRNIDGILDANVIISYPKDDPLNPTAQKKDITASVYVKHSGVLDDPNSHLASKIKSLVASSVSGLKYDNVTLIPDRARFTDLKPSSVAKNAENTQYIRLWSVAVAQSSVTRFRLIFFSFCLLVLFLVLALIWVVWKTTPLLQSHGGIKELFRLRHIEGGGQSEQKKSAPTEKKTEKAPHEGHEDDDLFHEESFADESADFGGDIDVSDEERYNK